MSLRETLKKNKTVRGRRWIIKMDNNKKLREVKMFPY